MRPAATRNRGRCALLVFLAASCASPAARLEDDAAAEPASAPTWNADVDLLLGVREFEDETFANDADQFAMQVSATFRKIDRDVGVEVALSQSSELDLFDQRDGRSRELALGVRLDRDLGRDVSATLGAGAAYLWARRDDEDLERDRTVAPYVHGGLSVQMVDVRVGIDLRYLLGGDLDLGDGNEDANYRQIALLVGFTRSF